MALSLHDPDGSLMGVSPGFRALMTRDEAPEAAIERLLGEHGQAFLRSVRQSRTAGQQKAATRGWTAIGVPFADDVVLLWYEDAQERLAEREVFIRQLFDRSPIGLNLCRLDGLWIESNQAFLEIIGYTANEADGGLTYWQLTPREYEDAEQQQLDQLMSEGRYGPYEKEFIRKDGSRIPVRLHGFLIHRDQEQFIWSMIEDIREERALQRTLDLEQQKLAQAAKLASLGEMAAGLAHEVNNPLALIEALAFSIEQQLKAGDIGSIAPLVADIRAATQRAGHVVRGLQGFARKEPPQSELGCARFMVDEALRLLEPRLRYEDVELRTELTARGLVRVQPTALAQVLLNLVNNSLDAVRSTPSRWVRVTLSDEPEWIVLTVEDNGPGVPASVTPRLFTPFVTTKNRGEGTGLGLSITKGILESHGGTIHYDGGAEWTRFVARLPRITGEAPR